VPPTSRPFAEAGLPHDRPLRRGRSAPGPRVDAGDHRLGERLASTARGCRHRHLQYGISSPVAVMGGGPSQRTSRIELGTAVIPLGWENPLRLAEDLATVDILSGGRINPGVSVGPPMHFDQLKEALYPTRPTSRTSATSGCGGSRLRARQAGHRLSGVEGFEVLSDRVQAALPRSGPSPLVRRVAARARRSGPGEHGMNFLTAVSSGPKGRRVKGLRRDPALPTSVRSAPTTPTATPPASPRAWWSSPRTPRRPNSARSTRSSPASALLALRHAGSGPADVRAGHRRHLGGDRRTPCTRTPRSGRSTRWRSRSRSPSSTRTTYRSSRTWRRSWDRRSGAGVRLMGATESGNA